MKKTEQYRWILISTATLTTALGVSLFIWPQLGAMAICWILGTLIVASGTGETMRYFHLKAGRNSGGLSLGISSILTGILLFVHSSEASLALPLLAGLYAIVCGTCSLQQALTFRSETLRFWWVPFVTGILGTSFGLFVGMNLLKSPPVSTIFLALALVFNGIDSLCTMLCTAKASR